MVSRTAALLPAAPQLCASILIAAAVLLIYWYWQRKRYFAKYLGDLPGPWLTLPVVGNIVQTLLGPTDELLQNIVKLYRTYDLGPYKFWMGEEMFVAGSKPEFVEVVMSSPKLIYKPSLPYDAVRGLFGKGLITLSGEEWRQHRKIITPAFHFKVLERYAEIFVRRGKALAETRFARIPSGSSVDLMPEFSKFVTETIWETAFGLEDVIIDEQDKKEFMEAVHESFVIISKRVLMPWLINEWLFWLTPMYRKFVRAEDLIIRHGKKIINLKKAEIEQRKASQPESATTAPEDDIGLKKRVAFLDMVLDQDGDLLNDEEVLNEVRTLIAVQQTSATTMSFTAVLLAIYPEVQDRVVQEIREVEALGLPAYEAVNRMKYLERVLKESLRLYPNTPLIAREVRENLLLPDGTIIPPGTKVSNFIYLTHRDPRHWGPDPEKFDPDNFLPERCTGRHPFAFVPFSAGPRNCIGQRYAMLQMKAVLSEVLKKHKFLPGSGCESQASLKLNVDTFLHIIGGFNVCLKPRRAP